ncbi:MAG: hypothetical protein VXZ72_05035 [Chlamydiota bacterium]|nr:hypothetical protein [Chlamydiota bacterium]
MPSEVRQNSHCLPRTSSSHACSEEPQQLPEEIEKKWREALCFQSLREVDKQQKKSRERRRQWEMSSR